MKKMILLFPLICFFNNISYGQWNLISTQDTLFHYDDICITPDSTIFVCGGDYNYDGLILRSKDFGNSWDTTNIIYECLDISFPTNNIGFVIVKPGSVYKTIDGGDNWNLLINTLDFNRPSQDILFINADTGFVSSQDGWATFYRTYDGGTIWNQLTDTSLISGQQLIGGRSIFFDDSSMYVVCGGYFLVSSNYGDNWQSYSNDSIYNTNETISANKNNILMAGQGANSQNYGIVSKSTDGGINWNILGYNDIYMFRDIEMTSSQIGYLVGMYYDSTYAFMKTIDSGLNWYKQAWTGNYQYYFGLNAIDCINDSTGFAVGYNGSIFRTTNGGGPLYASIPEVEYESNVIMFPNPADDKITIVISKKATLEISNINGQIIKTINNDSGETSIDIRDFSSGIYIVRVMTDKEIVTKKFIKE